MIREMEFFSVLFRFFLCVLVWRFVLMLFIIKKNRIGYNLRLKLDWYKVEVCEG